MNSLIKCFTHQVLIVEEPSSEPRETKPANLVALKTAASSLRDTIMQAEREEEHRSVPDSVRHVENEW